MHNQKRFQVQVPLYWYSLGWESARTDRWHGAGHVTVAKGRGEQIRLHLDMTMNSVHTHAELNDAVAFTTPSESLAKALMEWIN